MRIYLDTCSLQRPLDSKTQIRIILEAEFAQADYFCTCDDKLLRQVKGIAGLEVQVVSPIELVEAIEQ